jgi:hypothetical protein
MIYHTHELTSPSDLIFKWGNNRMEQSLDLDLLKPRRKLLFAIFEGIVVDVKSCLVRSNCNRTGLPKFTGAPFCGDSTEKKG